MPKSKNPAAVALGTRGGLKTSQKWGKKHYQDMQKKGVLARKQLSTAKQLTSGSKGV